MQLPRELVSMWTVSLKRTYVKMPGRRGFWSAAGGCAGRCGTCPNRPNARPSQGPNFMKLNQMRWTLIGVVAAAAFWGMGGCSQKSPFDDDGFALDQQVRRETRAQIMSLKQGPLIEVARGESRLYQELDEEQIAHLDSISGPGVYRTRELDAGVGLDGQAPQLVRLSLQRAIEMAMQQNIDLKLARLVPAVSEANVVAAEALFDATFFTNASFSIQDRPRQTSRLGGTTIGTSLADQDDSSVEIGIRKLLDSGGQLTISTGWDYVNNRARGINLVPDPAFTNRVTLALSQPLLRNFGAQVNRAQIMISRNALRRDALLMHGQANAIIGQVEASYWQLVFAISQLAIQQHLLEQTLETQRIVQGREGHDVTQLQLAQAESFVTLREGDVLQAERNVYEASDRLKLLVNSPHLPLGDEMVIVPTDQPIEMPVNYNLLDAITTALRHRPEVREALVNIDDASIRQQVADNQRLPLLTVNAQLEYYGLDTNIGGAYGELDDGNFLEYLASIQFEQPIGSRLAEADYRRSRLERQAVVLDYRNVVRNSILDVKSALRNLQTSWKLIATFRDARRAAAENLRALQARKDSGIELTPEFLLSEELDTQQRVAQSELQELQALVDYNIALIQLHQATGTLLEHNNVELIWPAGMFSAGD